MRTLLTRTDLIDLIAGGENSGIEFKRDDIAPRDLAKELVAFVNLEGGRVLLGVEDDGTVSGITRTPAEVEEWVMNACRTLVRPGLIPFLQIVPEVEPGRAVAVVQVERGWTVHQRWFNNRPFYYIRVGSESREMDAPELERLFQQRGSFRVEIRPVPGSGLEHLDLGRLRDYFERVRQQDAPDLADADGWTRLLLNTEIMVQEDTPSCSVAGLLLFGRNPNRFLPQAGITAAVYPGTEKDLTRPTVVTGPMVSLFQDTAAGLEIVEPGIIDRVMAFLERHATDGEELGGGAWRTVRWHYPREALREALVNAVAHRDYLLAATDIEVAVYENRIEIISPGRLTNGITPERMRAGCRAARNQLVKDTLRDYGYMEHLGLGVPRKIVRLMQEANGTDPDLIAEDERFIVRLWREPR